MGDGVGQDEVLAVVTGLIEQLLADREGGDPPPVDGDSVLYATDDTDEDTLDLDSLDALDIIGEIEQHFGISVPEDIDFTEVRRVGDIVAIVLDQVSSP